MDKQKELIELEHKYKMEEIETERKAQLEVENIRFDHQKQLQRLKRADIARSIEMKHNG